MNVNTRLCLIKSRGEVVKATPGTSEKGTVFVLRLACTLPSC